jgi:hypothetical protein
MSSLERAKAFLKGRAARLALTLIPLTIIAVPAAQAADLCKTWNPTCDVLIRAYWAPAGSPYNLFPQPGLTVSAVTGAPNGVVGVNFSGSGFFEAPAPGGYVVFLNAQGTSDGTSLGTDTIPVDYSMVWDATEAGQRLSYDLPLTINGQPTSQAIPEPASFLLAGAGVLLAFRRRGKS